MHKARFGDAHSLRIDKGAAIRGEWRQFHEERRGDAIIGAGHTNTCSSGGAGMRVNDIDVGHDRTGRACLHCFGTPCSREASDIFGNHKRNHNGTIRHAR